MEAQVRAAVQSNKGKQPPHQGGASLALLPWWIGTEKTEIWKDLEETWRLSKIFPGHALGAKLTFENYSHKFFFLFLVC